MTNQRLLSYISLIGFAILGFGILNRGSAFSSVQAQSNEGASEAAALPSTTQTDATTNGTAWASSAEPAPGTAVAALSAPDALSAPTQVDGIISQLISWRVTGAALKPRENDVNYSINGSGSCAYVTSGDASTVWNMPINLPNGSTVQTLRMYYYDNSASNTTA